MGGGRSAREGGKSKNVPESTINTRCLVKGKEN